MNQLGAKTMKRQDVIKARAPDDVDKLLFTHVRPLLMEMAREKVRDNMRQALVELYSGYNVHNPARWDGHGKQ